jgi:beta-glucanase (GH16 family)
MTGVPTGQPHRRRRAIGLALAGLAMAGSLAILPGAEAKPVPRVGWLIGLIHAILGGGSPTTTVPPTTAPPTTAPPTTEPPTTTPPTEPPEEEPGLACDLDGAPAIDPITGTEWTCTFADEFDGTVLDPDVWVAQTSALSGFGSHDDCYMDDPENVAVRDGRLELSVVRQPEPFTCVVPKRGGNYTTQYTSASVSTYQRWSQAFGRYEIRAKFPSSTQPGLQGSLWLWPDDATKYGPWPMSGEIDIAEVYSQYNDRAIPYIHYVTTGSDVTNNYCLLTVDDWHTYTLEWTPSTLTIRYDGEVCVEHTIAPLVGAAPQPFDSPFMLALTEGLGLKGNALDPSAPPPFPATLQVDYVRVWS